MAASHSGKSSQCIVDELFKDFIAQKINKISSKDDHPQLDKKTRSTAGSSVDEISKILDMEINSIQKSSGIKDLEDKKTLACDEGNGPLKVQSEKTHHKTKSGKRSGSISKTKVSSSKKIRNCVDVMHTPSTITVSTELSSHRKEDNFIPSKAVRETVQKEEIINHPKQQESLPLKSVPSSDSIPSLPSEVSDVSKISLPEAENADLKLKTVDSSSHTECDTNSSKDKSSSQPLNGDKAKPSDTAKNSSGLMLPAPLAKKQAIPKQLGLKLTSTSLSLIKSMDRVDKDGRVWEEGEINSSHSERGMTDNESEADGYPSDTGSINSTAEGWKEKVHQHPKKHKHKHKKKKKKSSSKDTEKGTHERDQDSLSEEKSSSQDRRHSKQTGKSSSGDGERSRKRSRSKSKESSRKRNRDESSDKPTGKSSKDTENKSSNHRKRSHSRSRSRSPKHGRSSHKSQARYRSPKRSHHDERDARHRSSKHRSRDRSSDRSKRKSDHDDRKTKETREQRLNIDKAKLRRIAIANALVNMKAGQGPQVDVPAVKSGGKSVQELTEFCKKISEKGNTEEGSEVSDSSEDNATRASDEEELLIHHPFKIKEPPSSAIVMNIRNSKQLPVLTPLEKQAQKANLRLAFPVSSGSHHRANESEWVPVERPSANTAARAAPTVSAPTSSQQGQQPWTSAATSAADTQIVAQEEPPKSKSIFPESSEAQKIDIGTIISERLQAVRKLQQNPYDVQALSSMHKAQEQATKWAASKNLPGQFTGSTGVKVLSQAELIGDKKHQAWAKKTQMTQAAPVNGGIGMFLLQKMGWKHGEGLGKNNEGNKEPLLLDVKVDRKGLSAAVENPQKKIQTAVAGRAKDLSNKHPVSALMELCNRRKWGPPMFTVVDESGPDHKKNFLFKVKVNNIEYQPTVPSSNKKTAKAQCAGICLQELGLLPRDAPLNI